MTLMSKIIFYSLQVFKLNLHFGKHFLIKVNTPLKLQKNFSFKYFGIEQKTRIFNFTNTMIIKSKTYLACIPYLQWFVGRIIIPIIVHFRVFSVALTIFRFCWGNILVHWSRIQRLIFLKLDFYQFNI